MVLKVESRNGKPPDPKVVREKNSWLRRMADIYSPVKREMGKKAKTSGMTSEDVGRILSEEGETFSIERMKNGELEIALRRALFKRKLQAAWSEFIPEMDCPVCLLTGEKGKWTKGKFPECTVGGKAHYWVWKISHLTQCQMDPLVLLREVKKRTAIVKVG